MEQCAARYQPLRERESERESERQQCAARYQPLMYCFYISNAMLVVYRGRRSKGNKDSKGECVRACVRAQSHAYFMLQSNA